LLLVAVSDQDCRTGHPSYRSWQLTLNLYIHPLSLPKHL